MNNSNPENIKICPMLAINPANACECLGEDCAWYVPPINPRQEGRCAANFLGMLPYIAKAVNEL